MKLLQALKMLHDFKKQYALRGDLASYREITKWIASIEARDRIAIEDAEITYDEFLRREARG